MKVMVTSVVVMMRLMVLVIRLVALVISGSGSTRPLMMRRYGYIPLHSVTSDTAPALSPESTFFVENYAGDPSSTTPVLLELCVDSFDTAPPPCHPACLALLCLLSCVDSFDTAPPPPSAQDLLTGLLYTVPPPSTGNDSFDPYLSNP
ncbi:uncharacterized protein UHOD_11108 [Ustilago sp. UG-2017b]|nr:uncharacterized protein UHOD_11108 [Ustilago sp. UG-2017b]